MDLSLLEKLLATTGLGGFCVGVLLFIFKEILRARFLSQLTKEHSYRIINTIIWLTWSVGITGLLSWGGLRVIELNNSKYLEFPSAATTQAEQPKLISRVFERKIQDNTPDTNVKVAEIHLEYIEVAGLQNKLVEKKINEYIKGSIGINEKFDGTEDLTMFIKEASIDGNLLSIVAEGTYYGHGAASAANQVLSINLNIKNGEPVQFKDLFRAGYQEKINQSAKTWFATQSYENSFEGVKDDQCFYFDGNNLYLCFSEYEVAPGAEGIVTAKITLEDIRGLISLNGPLAFAI
jgi:hypothetical protein